MSAVFYFGCVFGAGHYLHTPELRTTPRAGPFTSTTLDTPFCPGMTPDSSGRTPDEQPEGVARLTHAEGWTVLSFWDRSIDNRRGSHSTYAIEGTHVYAEAVRLARAAFPRVWARYKFEVRPLDPAHAERPSDATAADIERALARRTGLDAFVTFVPVDGQTYATATIKTPWGVVQHTAQGTVCPTHAQALDALARFLGITAPEGT